MVGGVTFELVTLENMDLTYNALVGSAFEGAMLYGREMIIQGRNFSTNDEILEVVGAPVCYNGYIGDSLS